MSCLLFLSADHHHTFSSILIDVATYQYIPKMTHGMINNINHSIERIQYNIPVPNTGKNLFEKSLINPDNHFSYLE